MRVNYKSDFDFILALTDNEGEDIGFPPFDFSVRLTTKSSYRAFEASCVSGVCNGCYNDGGRLHIVAARHGLYPGRLKVDFFAKLPNAVYPESYQRIASPLPVDIELVPGECDYPMAAEVEMPLAVVVRTAYDLAVQQGYEGTAEEYMAATLNLVQTVDEARMTLEQSQQAASTAADAAEEARRLTADASDAIGSANEAAHEASGAAELCRDAAAGAEAAADAANTAAAEALREAHEAAEAAGSLRGRSLADTDRDNHWSATQTFGDIVVGDIVQVGEAYETHAEVVYTTQDLIHLRDGAVSGIPAGSYVGLVARLYNGEDDGYLVYDNSGARVGKAGDTEPLLTRAEREEMVPFAPLVWDAQRNRAVSGEWPSLPAFRTVEMVVTYEDDSTETFNVMVQ